MGGGSKKQTETQSITPYQQEDYDVLLQAATDKFQGGGYFDPQLFGGRDTRAAATPEQMAFMEQLGGAQGAGMDALMQTLGPYDPNNPALTSAIDMAAGDVNRNLQENLLPGIGDSASAAGQFGSSRQGIAEGLALRGASEQVGDIATQMRLQDMQTWQSNQQNALSNLGGLAQGLEYAGGGVQREQQAALDDLFSRWEYESGVDLQNLQAYKGLISGDMGGESSGIAKGGGGK